MALFEPNGTDTEYEGLPPRLESTDDPWGHEVGEDLDHVLDPWGHHRLHRTTIGEAHLLGAPKPVTHPLTRERQMTWPIVLAVLIVAGSAVALALALGI